LLHLPDVREAASKADVVKVSLSAWDQSSFVRVNRPHDGLTFEQLIQGQMDFRSMFKGQLWMEVFLIKNLNSSIAEVERIARLTERIAPDRIHLNTVVRPPAVAGIRPLSRQALLNLCPLFHPTAEVIADFDAGSAAQGRENEIDILDMLKRRPCTAAQIAASGGININEALKRLGKMVGEGKIRLERKNDETYYCFQQQPIG
jgi:wyosine [tRNA(Phe)-imidazoG37] synthetase (radical SAM superfamily)